MELKARIGSQSAQGARRLRVLAWSMGTGLIVLAGLGTWSLASSSISEAACDATTGATCKVTGVKTTLSSATLSWTEGRHNNSRTFCYGIGTPSKCAEVTSRATGVKDQTVTGLAANTKYAYKFYGTYHNAIKSVVTGTFTTDGTGCGTSLITVVEVDGVVLSATGDSLENVVAVIAKQTGGQIVARDTTDRSGQFLFEVDPGTYTITLSYPPFTAPAPATAVVIAKKPLNIPDQIMKDAFLVGGTVVTNSPVDSIFGATITVLKKSDNSLAGTCQSDYEGHFSLGLKAGDYLINASYLGKTLPAPISLTVTKSVELPNLVLPISTGIRMRVADWPGKRPEGIPGLEAVDAKGARLSDHSAHAVELFRRGN